MGSVQNIIILQNFLTRDVQILPDAVQQLILVDVFLVLRFRVLLACTLLGLRCAFVCLFLRVRLVPDLELLFFSSLVLLLVLYYLLRQLFLVVWILLQPL